MSKLSLTLVFIFILSGCSAVRQQGKTIKNPDYTFVNDLTGIIKTNITGQNLVIPKASINIVNNGEEKKLLGTLRFKNNGTYLFSIKSQAGIEIARVLITNDTILGNDRINRKIFYGSPESLAGKYGISFKMLPLILGDYVDFKEPGEKKFICKNGIAKIEFQENDQKIFYEIDCSKGKIVKTVITDDEGKEGMKITMSRFVMLDGLTYPGLIVLEDLRKETVITLKI